MANPIKVGKLGYEAIEFAIRKFMAKNTKGIASIPGQKMKDKIKILVDKYATQFLIKGQDINTVTVKQVDNAIDYGMSLKKQQIKKLEADAAKKQAEYDYITSEKGIKEKMDELFGKSPAEIRDIMRKRSNVIKGDFNPKEEWWKAKPKKPDFASGGMARVGLGKGKLVKGFFEFVEGLFIKASNDIRQGKGLFKGLGDKEKWAQHENLTKMVEKWQKTKTLPEGAEQYFGVDAKKVFTQMNEKKDDILKNLTHDFKGKPHKGVAQTVEGTVVDAEKASKDEKS